MLANAQSPLFLHNIRIGTNFSTAIADATPPGFSLGAYSQFPTKNRHWKPIIGIEYDLVREVSKTCAIAILSDYTIHTSAHWFSVPIGLRCVNPNKRSGWYMETFLNTDFQLNSLYKSWYHISDGKESIRQNVNTPGLGGTFAIGYQLPLNNGRQLTTSVAYRRNLRIPNPALSIESPVSGFVRFSIGYRLNRSNKH